MANIQPSADPVRSNKGLNSTSAGNEASGGHRINKSDATPSEPKIELNDETRHGGLAVIQNATDVAEDEVKPKIPVPTTNQSDERQPTPAATDTAAKPKVGKRGKRTRMDATVGNEKVPIKRQRQANTTEEPLAMNLAAIRIVKYWPVNLVVKFFKIWAFAEPVQKDILIRRHIEQRVEKEAKEIMDEQEGQQDGEAKLLKPQDLDLASVKEDKDYYQCELMNVKASELLQVVSAFGADYHPKEDPFICAFLRDELNQAKLPEWVDNGAPAMPKPIKAETSDD
ncbi:hypothetical protein IWZ03DRAFT_361227 [Phyllosticta citriasiana]|uniref:Uncharacterized protein n=1 Tax=Phyllosticta citriasiana TaxID=595635 RepID=A0ABR1KH41_9PEZI